jgi:hypothetical protein
MRRIEAGCLCRDPGSLRARVAIWPIDPLEVPARETGVKPLSPNHRLVIALHSPDGPFETGLCMCPAENPPESLAAGSDGTLSPVRFDGETWAIAAISSDFRGLQRSFFAIQTAWRRAQSRANHSPLKFHATRGKIQGICKILPPKIALLLSKSHILREKPPITCKSEQD